MANTHAHCTTHSVTVRLDQTEGHCRDGHGCSDEACPLEKELGRPRFARALDIMASAIGHVAPRR